MRSIAVIFLTLFILVAMNTSAAAQTADPDLKTPASVKPGDAKNGKHVQMTDIHDIKPLEKIGFDHKLLIYLAALVLAVLLIAALIYYFKKRRKKEKQISHVTDPPGKIAFRSMDELMGMQDLSGKEFYFRLSLIIRNYIQGRYNINAPEMTTEEFIPEIRRLALSRELQESLKRFVITSDPVKFAGAAADRSKIKSDLEFARGLVKETIPEEIENI